MRCFVMNGIAPNVVGTASFKKMVIAIQKAGPNYTLPNKHDMGIRSHASDGNVVFGRVLQECLTFEASKRQHFLSATSEVGATLCSDGAKNCKRSAINSTLQSPLGSFYWPTQCMTV